MNQKITNESRLSVALQNDLEQLTEEMNLIEAQSVICYLILPYLQIVSENKTTKDVEEIKKNFIRNTMGGQRNDALMKMIRKFSPTLTENVNDYDVTLLDKEFCL